MFWFGGSDLVDKPPQCDQAPWKLISRLTLWPHDSCNRLIDASCLFCLLKRLVALITSSPSNFSMWGVFCGSKITLSLACLTASFFPPPPPSLPAYLPPSADTCRSEATIRCILQESTSARVQISHKRAWFQLWVPHTPTHVSSSSYIWAPHFSWGNDKFAVCALACCIEYALWTCLLNRH